LQIVCCGLSWVVDRLSPNNIWQGSPPHLDVPCVQRPSISHLGFLLQILYSPPLTGRKLLQAPAVDLTNATTVASIMTIAAQSAPTQPDEATRAALIQNLSGDQIVAVSQAVANLNAISNACTDAACVLKSQHYSDTQVSNF